MYQGRIEVIAGGMFSGKTEELIRRLRRAKIARKAVGVFKHGLDDRYSEEDLGSHAGLKLMAVADDVFKPHAVCMVCGEDATHSFHKGEKPAAVSTGWRVAKLSRLGSPSMSPGGTYV